MKKIVTMTEKWPYIAEGRHDTQSFYSYRELLKKGLDLIPKLPFSKIRILEFGSGLSTDLIDKHLQFLSHEILTYEFNEEFFWRWRFLFSKRKNIFISKLRGKDILFLSFENLFDLAFIDADVWKKTPKKHHYSWREEMLKKAVEYLKYGGLLVFHDAERHHRKIFEISGLKLLEEYIFGKYKVKTLLFERD